MSTFYDLHLLSDDSPLPTHAILQGESSSSSSRSFFSPSISTSSSSSSTSSSSSSSASSTSSSSQLPSPPLSFTWMADAADACDDEVPETEAARLAQLNFLRTTVPKLIDHLAQYSVVNVDKTPAPKRARKTNRAAPLCGPKMHHKIELVGLMGSGEKATRCANKSGFASSFIILHCNNFLFLFFLFYEPDAPLTKSRQRLT